MPVLTKEDRILISELNTLKGFGAKKLINEFDSIEAAVTKFLIGRSWFYFFLGQKSVQHRASS